MSGTDASSTRAPTVANPEGPCPPTCSLACLAARNGAACCPRNGASLSVLSSLRHVADSLKDCVRQTGMYYNSSARTGAAAGVSPFGRRGQFVPPSGMSTAQITLPAAYGSHVSASHSRHSIPDVEGAINRYERSYHARLDGGLLEDYGRRAAAPSSSSHAQPTATAYCSGVSPARAAGMRGDFRVDLARYDDVQEVYPHLSFFLDAGAVRHSLQVTAALHCDQDARQWRQEREDMLHLLRRVPPLHMVDGSLGGQPAAAALDPEGISTRGDTLQLTGVPAPLLRQSPALTPPECRLVEFLRLVQSSAFCWQSPESRLPLHLLLQLPGAAASAAVDAAEEGRTSSQLSLEAEARRLQIDSGADTACPPFSVGRGAVEDPWRALTAPQRQQFTATFRQIVGCCRLLADEARLRSGNAETEGSLHGARPAAFLHALVGNSLAALEFGRRQELDKLVDRSAAGTRWWAEWGVDDAGWCAGADAAAHVWIFLAKAELQEERGGAHREATGGGDDAAAEPEDEDRDAIWWRAVYHAFRTADLKCLIALGAGDFLPAGGCSLPEACAAVAAAAAAPMDSESKRAEEDAAGGSVRSNRRRTLPPQPPMLPFVCRHLLSRVLGSSTEANRRSLTDIAVNEEERRSVADMLGVLPSVAALQPPSSSVALGRLLLLYPPEKLTGGEGDGAAQKQAKRRTDAYLPLLLSLVNPSMWPPVNVAVCLRRFSQDDFLHYKLHLALLQSDQALEPQAALSASLLELAEKFRQRGAAYFDSSLSDGSRLGRVYVNAGYPMMLAACGCFFEAVTWLMENTRVLRRAALLLLLLLRECGAARHPQLKKLDPAVPIFEDVADRGAAEPSAAFSRLVERGLEDSSVLAKIVVMTVLPRQLWSHLSRSLVSHHFALLSSPLALGSLSCDEDAILPGLLSGVLGAASRPAPGSQLHAAGELGAAGSLALDRSRQRLLSRLYADIRDEGRRRRALTEAFVAAWLLSDFRSCEEILADALEGDVFSNFHCPPDDTDSRRAKFFLAAYPLLQRRLPQRGIEDLGPAWLHARIMWRARQGEFRAALALFVDLSRSSQPPLVLPPSEGVSWMDGGLRRAAAARVARLVDCVAYLLVRLIERGAPLPSLVSREVLTELQETSMKLPPSATRRLHQTRATLYELLRRYANSQSPPPIL
ncbi:hypothetical protein BESB_027150 [Besnoitia besnoiti]|uniref:Uncharacterized protein n=1 Tax=Besnoitia besnoiti TaxID=94643 RepID=A0A2A9M7A0_BESBE|nr:uncharacterized protein BESB_027150 [Besnoitia besnoiti]PFH31280.1 hypothetical protein BESB_027150 [Besnoitia besnoiti]